MSITAIAAAEQEHWSEVVQYWNHARSAWTDSVAADFEEGLWRRLASIEAEFGDVLSRLARECCDARNEVP